MQTRSEALVALIDDTFALKHAMWIDPGTCKMQRIRHQCHTHSHTRNQQAQIPVALQRTAATRLQ